MDTELYESSGSPYEYHRIVLRSRARLRLFDSDAQRADFLRLVHRAQRRTGIRILAYRLLENEAEFVVQAIRGTSTRSRFVQRLKSQYARRLHGGCAAADRPNNLFVRRYTSNKLALPAVPEVIQRLHQPPPQKAPAGGRSRYRWSSLRAHMRAEEVPWLCVNWVLELDQLPQFPWPLPLSASATQQFMLQLIEAVAAKLELPSAELYSRKRSRHLTLARGVIAYHAVRWGVTLRCVAQYLKGDASSTLSPSTLIAAIDRYEPLRPELFTMQVQELLSHVPAWRIPHARLTPGARRLHPD